MTEKHDKKEYEIIAKRVIKMLERQYPGQDLHFMAFIMDVGEDGYIGYCANVERVDAARMVMEWLSQTLGTIHRERFIEILENLKKERWPDD